jgi:hypothetical protein
MATFAPGMPPASADDQRETPAAKLTALIILFWVVIGPVVGIIYEFRISMRDWTPAEPSALLQMDQVKVAYFSQAQQDFFIGCGVWILGLIVLAYIYARNHIFQVGK